MRRVFIALSLLGGVACATTPAVQPLAVSPVNPGANEKIVIDHSYLVVDSSSSVEDQFAMEKALVQSFVGAMPEGSYQAGTVAFGGYARDGKSLATFDRAALKASADGFEHLSEGTPIDRVLGEITQELTNKTGRAAIVVFSDGVPTDPSGRDLDSAAVLAKATDLTKAYQGEVCFHTVHVGDDPAGAAFLKQLAGLTPCGTTRATGSIQNIAALESFEREVYLAAVPAVAARGVADTDGDGVSDEQDRCPGTPRAAIVDARGCWHVPGLNFAHDSAKIEAQYSGELNALVTVLKNNPTISVQIEGHTDSTGSDAYNLALSERRAKAVRAYLESNGIPSARLTTKGFGESVPAGPNDTEANRRSNRRTELSTVN